MKTSIPSTITLRPSRQLPPGGSGPASLHMGWAQPESEVQLSPVIDALLRSLKTRFRVETVKLLMVKKGRVVINLRAGSDPGRLDHRGALDLCRGQPNNLLAIEDAAASTTGDALANSVRFYAGAPLVISPGGPAIGMLCLIDSKPKGFSAADSVLFEALALAISVRLLMPHEPAAAIEIALSVKKGVLLLSESQTIEALSPRFTELTGFVAQDLLKTGADDLLCLDRPGSGALLISHALLAEVPAYGMTRCHTKTGHTLPVEVFVLPLADEDDRVVKTLLLIAPLFSGPLEDFLLSLRSSERSELLSIHIAGLWAVDINGLIGKLSGAPVAHVDTTTLESFVGKRLDKTGVLDAAQTSWDAFYQSIAEHNLPGEVECCVTHNGLSQWYSMVGFKQYDARGQVMGYHGSFRNITPRKLKEIALRKATERQQLILKGANDGAWDWDMETGEYYLSARWWEMMGRDPNAYPQTAEIWSQFIHPDDRPGVRSALVAAVENGSESFQSEFRLQHQQGHYFPVLGRGHILRDSAGKAVRTSGTNQDLTAQRSAQARIELLKSCVESLQDVVLITQAEPSQSPGPIIVYVNPAFEAGTGYTNAEVIGKTPRILQGPLTSRRTLDDIAAALRSWKSIRCELANYKKNGELFWAELELLPVAAEGGERYTHWIGVQRDITERKRSEQVLKTTSQRLGMALEATGLGLWVNYLERREAFHDAGWYAMLGLPAYDTMTNTEDWLQLIHPADAVKSQQQEREIIDAGNGAFDRQFRMRHADGRWVWIQRRGKVIARDAAGKSLVLAGTHLDITARVESEQALQSTVERLAMAIAATDLGLWVYYLDGRKAFRDEGWHKMLGDSPSAGVSSSDEFLNRIHPDDRARIRAGIEGAAQKSDEPFENEYRMRHAHGRWVWIQSRGKVTKRDADGKALVLAGTHLDITAKVEARQLAEKKDSQLARCLEHMHVGVSIQHNGSIKFVNSAFLQMFGVAQSENLVGSPISAFVLPSDTEALLWRRDQLMAGAVLPSIWFNAVHRDGYVFKVLTNSTVIDWDGEPHIMSTSVLPSEGALLLVEVEKTRIRYEDLLVNQVDKEQVHTAHELHDSLGSQLAGIALQAASLKLLGGEGKPLADAVDQLLGNIQSAAEVTRNLARGLAPVDAWPGAIVYALKKLCHDFSKTNDLRCDFDAVGDFDSVGGQAANHLFRITQEAIANALRHGAAQRIHVSLTRAGDAMALTIFDDGKGFDARSYSSAPALGLGLSSMYARAHAIGAHITLERMQPKGFCVSVHWTQP